MISRKVALVLVAAGLLGWRPGAYAQSCTPITSVPTVITESGVYCLTESLVQTTIHVGAISVDAAAVVVDLGGYRLKWSGSTSSGNAAITVSEGSRNAVIRNGIISGFTVAVESYAPGTIVEDLRMNNNDLGVAIREGAEGALIRRNYFRLGNGVQVDGQSGGGTNNGSVRIIDNDFHGVSAEGGGSGYNGVDIQGRNAMVIGNRFGRLYTGVWFDPLTQATGKYRDNVTTNVTFPYTGGTNAGNND